MQSVDDPVAVYRAVTTYGDNPSAFLALNTGNEFFTAPDLAGVVAYRRAGRYLVQFAGAFSPTTEYSLLLERFLAFAGERRRRVIAIQLQRADAEIYARHGFTVNQVGTAYALRLDEFSLRGGRFMQLRNKISRARRSGVTVSEVSAAAHETQLAELDREWLRGKGRHARPLRFLVGERTGPLADRHRLFVGRLDSRLMGYITYAPVSGTRPGWLHDLSRRRDGAQPGLMEAINVTAIERFRSENAAWLHFGFTPFVGLAAEQEVASASRLVARMVSLLGTHGGFVYPAATQVAYKEKWGPHVLLPEYVAFHGRPRLGAVWSLLRVTNAI